ncbi:MAG: hypothetical protein ACRDI2_04570, partial [Chloroflexota bacterium]
MMTFSAMPLSSLPAAWVADQIGLPSTLAVCAALSGLVVLTAVGASGWFAGRALTPVRSQREQVTAVTAEE